MKLKIQMRSEMKDIEKKYYVRALKRARMDREKAIKILGVSRPTFFRRTKALGITFKTIVIFE